MVGSRSEMPILGIGGTIWDHVTCKIIIHSLAATQTWASALETCIIRGKQGM